VSIAHPVWDDASWHPNEFDAVVIRTTWDYTSRRDEFVARVEAMAREVPVFNAPPLVRWNTEKSYLRSLEGAGVRIPPTRWLGSHEGSELGEWLEEGGWSRGFLKPTVGAAASNTLRFTNDAVGLARAAEHLSTLPMGTPMMLQPYLESVESLGEYSFIVMDGTITHGVRKVPVPGDYRVQDLFGAWEEAVTPSQAQRTFVHRVLDAAQQVGPDVAYPLLYARVDLLQDDAGEMCLNELELVEPSLFFRHEPRASGRLVKGLLKRLKRRAE
jgi:glutathione synthase/RimK-type ligase-like ATP-grasp enzyme